VRILAHKYIDATKPVDLKGLGSIEKIIVAFKNGYLNTSFYKTNEQRKLDRERSAEIKREEKLKTDLYSLIYFELSLNRTLGDKDICEEIVIRIPRSYEKTLRRVLQSDDFMVYDISEIRVNPDFLAAFEELPILLKIKKGGFL
jgi:hypothetical protein